MNSRLKSGCVRYRSDQNILATSLLLKNMKIKTRVSRPRTTMFVAIFENNFSTIKIIQLGVKRFVIFIRVTRDRKHNNGFGPFNLKIGRPWIKIY